MNKKLIWGIVISIDLLLIGYFFAGYMVFSQLTKTKECMYADVNKPEKFDLYFWDTKQKDNFSQWYFNQYEEIQIDSTTPGLKLAAYQVDQNKSKPWIIFVHGVGVCKEKQEVLFPMGIVVKAGYNALAIDLNDHGASDSGDGKVNAGLSEYRDVIGAWKYLREVKKVPAEKIGIYGASMGAGSVAMAFVKEPGIQSIWLDSVYFDMTSQMEEYLVYNGFPGMLFWSANIIAKFIGDMNLTALEPSKAATTIGSRNMFITHNHPDRVVQSWHGEKMCETAKSNSKKGGFVDCWFIDQERDLEDTPYGPKKAGHVVAAVIDQSKEYESRMLSYWQKVLSN